MIVHTMTLIFRSRPALLAALTLWLIAACAPQVAPDTPEIHQGLPYFAPTSTPFITPVPLALTVKIFEMNKATYVGVATVAFDNVLDAVGGSDSDDEDQVATE